MCDIIITFNNPSENYSGEIKMSKYDFLIKLEEYLVKHKKALD